VVSPGCLPRTPEIQNTGKAQRGPPILQTVHKVQAAAIAAEDNVQISNGCNSNKKIKIPASNLPLTCPELLSTHNLS